jgi:hypothetical protein
MQKKHIILLALLILPAILFAQVNPPRPLSASASPMQGLSFGAFAITGPNGGTVTVSETGMRTSTGDIFLAGNSQSCATFTIETIPGTSLFIDNAETSVLTGSNGGHLTMSLSEIYPTFPYTTLSPTTAVQVGGTLTVGPVQDNPPGAYSGTYTIIIVHE